MKIIFQYSIASINLMLFDKKALNYQYTNYFKRIIDERTDIGTLLVFMSCTTAITRLPETEYSKEHSIGVSSDE